MTTRTITATIVSCLLLAALLCSAVMILGATAAPARAATTTLVVAPRNTTSTTVPNYVCDGTKDQVQIQAAIDALEGKAGTVRLLDGTFNISSSILLHRDLTLQGAGDSTVIRLAANSNCDVITNDGGRSRSEPNVTIKSLKIDGNKANQTDGCGIYRQGENAVYDHLTILNCRARGLTHTGGDTVTVTNNVLRNCDGRGIFVSSSSYVTISHNSVYNCGLIMSDAEFTALDLWYGDHNVISYNYIDGGGLVRQLEARDTPAVEIIGNTLVNGLDLGIAPHARYARIVDNTIRNAGDNAIDLCGETDCLVQNNHISRVSGGSENLGIALNSKRTTVTGNFIELCGRAGIQLGPDCNDNQILNNVIKNCGQQETMGKTAIWLQIFKCDRPMRISNNVIRGNTCYDDQPAKTQQYGIMLTTASVVTGYIDGVVIEDNDLRGNAVYGIAPYDSSRVLNVRMSNNLLSYDTTAPPAPTLSSPANGAVTTVTTPWLSWSEVTDASQVYYSVQLDDNPDFSSPLAGATSLKYNSYHVTAALKDGVYYWRVKAVDVAGNTRGWTGKSAFRVDTTAPARPTLLSPAGGAHTGTTRPTLDWSDVTDATTVHYQLQVDNNSDFSSPKVSATWVTVSKYTVTSSLSTGTYYWRVRAVDRTGNASAWTASRSFIAP